MHSEGSDGKLGLRAAVVLKNLGTIFQYQRFRTYNSSTIVVHIGLVLTDKKVKKP